MSKFRAFLTHLGISATVVGVIFALVFFIWYPNFYFRISGAASIIWVLIGVDLVLGPALTLLVYKRDKPGLLFDMSTIAAVQLIALIYGTTVIFQERPYFTVFAIDRFEVLAKKEVDFSQLSDDVMAGHPAAGPVLAIATMPEDLGEAQALMFSVLFENKPDLERRPEYWNAYRDKKHLVLSRARPLAVLAASRPEAADKLATLPSRLELAEERLGFLPVITGKGHFSIIIDIETGWPVHALNVDPWITSDGDGKNLQADLEGPDPGEPPL